MNFDPCIVTNLFLHSSEVVQNMFIVFVLI